MIRGLSVGVVPLSIDRNFTFALWTFRGNGLIYTAMKSILRDSVFRSGRFLAERSDSGTVTPVSWFSIRRRERWRLTSLPRRRVKGRH